MELVPLLLEHPFRSCWFHQRTLSSFPSSLFLPTDTSSSSPDLGRRDSRRWYQLHLHRLQHVHHGSRTSPSSFSSASDPDPPPPLHRSVGAGCSWWEFLSWVSQALPLPRRIVCPRNQALTASPLSPTNSHLARDCRRCLQSDDQEHRWQAP